MKESSTSIRPERARILSGLMILAIALPFAAFNLPIAQSQVEGVISQGSIDELNVTGLENTQIIMILSPGCSKCAAAERVVEKLVGDRPEIKVIKYDYISDEGHRAILEYNVVDFPSLIVGGKVIGYKEYDGNDSLLAAMLQQALSVNALGAVTNDSKAEAAINETAADVRREGKEQEMNVTTAASALEKLSFSSIATVLLTGLAAGFNPCLLAVLAFLASAILANAGRRTDLLLMVVFFCLGIFTVYFLAGVGFFRILQDNSIASKIRLGLSMLLLILGLLQIEDARRLHAGKGSLFRTDWALGIIERAVARQKLGSYFLIGALISLVKAPCVGAVYIAIIGLISERGSMASGLVYLAAYNIGIVLPVLVLGALMAYGLSPDRVDLWRHDHRVGIRILTGVMLIALAPVIYWQLI
jgi:cytochrome c biogenesis protein CcdA